MKVLWPLPLVVLLSACAPSVPAKTAEESNDTAACPDAVRRSIGKQFATARLLDCKAQSDDGHDQFVVKLQQGAQKVEVDVAPDGTVLRSEAVVPIEEVPAKVMSAFFARYPRAKSTGAEKQVRPGVGTFYELKFDAQPKVKEATFAEDGTFIEEE